MKRLLHRHRHLLALVVVGLLALGILGRYVAPDHPLASLHEWLDLVLQKTRGLPLAVFIVAAGTLPLVGVPIVPLYLMAGAVYLPLYGLPVSFGAMMIALLINLVISHSLARWMRPFVERMVARFGFTMPRLGRLSVWKVILLVRITPGAPLMAQNYLLALAGVPLLPFLLVSLPVESMICGGYMAMGKSFATGHWGWLVGGGGAVIFVLLATMLVREHLAGADSNKSL
ncbi:hypothetical protein [Luteolibacter soli]|uniref:TVP38/TMEM64 family membrane protein n=1 Tax=Luteolibacter soli TaxID=3135280 RepID=A0ABU9B1Z7_9BACT